MIIALDYDDTYTADKALWNAFIPLAQILGHTVHIVTMRDGVEDWNEEFKELAEGGVKTIFCNGESKKDVTEREGIKIDIWIDDKPEGIASGSNFTGPDLDLWRKEQRASGGITKKVA